MARQGRIIPGTVPAVTRAAGGTRRQSWTWVRAGALALLLAACQAAASESPTQSSVPVSPSPAAGVTDSMSGEVRVLGDVGVGTPEEFAVAEAMRVVSAARPVDALVTTGDNLYIDDADLVWNQPFGWVAEAGIPVWAAFGNHDVESESRLLIAEGLFGTERYRSTQWGDVRFIILDANRPDDPGQLAWLDGQLAGAAGETVVAVFHQPAVSCSKHGATPSVVENWMDRFEAADVELVLQGHDHNYQHHLVDGIDYVVTGGGGHSLYPLTPCPDGSRPLAAAEEHHFVVLEQVEDRLEVAAIRPDGSVLDRFSISP